MSCLNGTSFDYHKRGQIQVIFGPMFSGKTTELIRRVKRYRFANYRCMIIRYANDVRYSVTDVSTHDKQTLSAVNAIELKPLEPDTDDIDVIGIDEGQFFPDIIEFCEKMASKGKIVLVAALDGTYQREGFGKILSLVPLAENVVKLTAVCMSCFSEAAFTKRLGCEKEVEVIGGAEKYMSVCRECHKLKSPVKRSPFKHLINDYGTSSVDVKRNLFSSDMETAP